MNTPATLDDQPRDRKPAQILSAARSQIVAAPADAANDASHADRDADDHQNPLWLLVFAGGCLFASMAALLALG